MGRVELHAIRSSSHRLARAVGDARTAGVARAAGVALLATVVLLLGIGCGAEDATNGRETASPAAAPAARPAAAKVDPAKATAEAKEIFAGRCVTCHGAEGGGDGPASKGLSPSPRDFRDAAWQDEVSDEHITNIVLYGGAAVGRSPTMPGNPDLISKPEVVEALVAHIRELGRG